MLKRKMGKQNSFLHFSWSALVVNQTILAYIKKPTENRIFTIFFENCKELLEIG